MGIWGRQNVGRKNCTRVVQESGFFVSVSTQYFEVGKAHAKNPGLSIRDLE